MKTEALLAMASSWLCDSGFTVCLGGAGLSTESGIPDFRSRGGIWDRFDPKDLEIRRWLASDEVRRKYWRMTLEGYPLLCKAQPSPGHVALARMARAGKLSLLVTQNTDGLHLKAGHDPGGIVELHGTSHVCACVTCGGKFPRSAVQERVQRGELVPLCQNCGGFLKPDAVFFGEGIPEDKLARAREAAEAAKVFLVVGSSLAVRPAGALPERALLRGARLIIVNDAPTRLDEKAHAVFRGKAGEILPRLLQGVME